MNRALTIIAILAVLLQPLTFHSNALTPLSSASQALQSGDLAGTGEMPGYPDPVQPIPYNHPGHQSKMGVDVRAQLAQTFKPWAAEYNTMSPQQVESTLEVGADYDPLIGNYTLVNWDQMAIVTPNNANPYDQSVRLLNASTLDWSPTVTDTTNTQVTLRNLPTVNNLGNTGAKGYSKSNAGDINADGVEEMVIATSSSGSVTNPFMDRIQIGNLSDKRYSKDAPSVASPHDGVTWVFARGYDDQLWMLLNGTWIPKGGILSSSPTAVSVSADRVDVIVLGTYKHVHRCTIYWNNPTGDCYWDDFGGAPDGQGYFVGEPVMAAKDANNLDLFVRGSDNTLWHREFKYGFFDWQNLGGYITSSPSATYQGDEVRVVATGYDGDLWMMSCIYYCNSDPSLRPTWEHVGGEPLGTPAYYPALVSPASGQWDVFYSGCLDSDCKQRGIFAYYFRNGAWGSNPVLTSLLEQGKETIRPISAPAATRMRGSYNLLTQEVTLVFNNYFDKFFEDGNHIQSKGIYSSKRTSSYPISAWPAFVRQAALGMWSRQSTMDPAFIDFALGHFLANGRMQMITYSLDSANNYRLRLNFYSLDGGIARKIGVETNPTMSPDGRISTYSIWDETGDFDGDGADELALMIYFNNSPAMTHLAYLYVIKLNSDGTIKAQAVPKLILNTINAYPLGLMMTHGDYNGETEQIADDELAIFTCWDDAATCNLNIYNIAGNYTPTGGIITVEDPITGPVEWKINHYYRPDVTPDTTNRDKNFGVANFSAASGDFIDYGGIVSKADEIVYAGTDFQSYYVFPVYHYRNVVVAHIYRLNSANQIEKVVTTSPDPAEIVRDDTKCCDMGENQVRVVTADLDRDNLEEIAVYYEMPTGTFANPGFKKVFYYKYETISKTYDYQTTAPVGTIVYTTTLTLRGEHSILEDNGLLPPAGEFQAGNFAGQGLRIEKPSYRVIKNVGNLVFQMNAPPIVYGDKDHNNAASYSRYKLEPAVEKQIVMKGKASITIEVGVSGFTGSKSKGTYIEQSLEASVGLDFERVNTGITQVTWSTTYQTAGRDLLVYSLTDVQLFEYPITDGSDGDVNYMIVTWPKIRHDDLGNPITNRFNYIANAYCYLPFDYTHDTTNPLSFASSEVDLLGDGTKKMIGYNPLDSNMTDGFSIVEKETIRQETTWTVRASISLKLFGQFNVEGTGGTSCYVKGTFAGQFVHSSQTTISQSVAIDGNIVAIKDGTQSDTRYSHFETPILYTNPEGTLILDYVVSAPINGWGSWWTGTGPIGVNSSGYGNPDLTFIRPWLGLDCAKNQGQNLEDFSSDVTFDKTNMNPGESVTVSVIVKNISLKNVSKAYVRFYEGDPDAGGRPLCSETEVSIPARGNAKATCTFTPAGAGVIRIYAVADPGKQINERYENNNKAYGSLYVAKINAGSVDPGQIIDKAGQQLALDTAGGLKTELFVPFSGMPQNEVTSFTIEPVGNNPRTFRITAKQSGDDGAPTSMGGNGTPYIFGSDDHTSPRAMAVVQYANSDLKPGLVEEPFLLLYRWNEDTKQWENSSYFCNMDNLMRDWEHNVIKVPICKPGIYGLMSSDQMPNPLISEVYLPLVRR